MNIFHEALAFIEPYIVAYGAFALFAIIYLESFGFLFPAKAR